MCYGNLDPKHALREAEARLKSVALAQDNNGTFAPLPAIAPLAWARAALARLMRKEASDV